MSTRVIPIPLRKSEIAARINFFVTIGIVALTLHIMLTVVTMPARNIERENDTVPFFDSSHLRPNLFNNPHRFMANDVVLGGRKCA
ncbi:hypothetical protein D3C81_1243420 [compost metagenome]